jgi:uncharacterized protein
MLGNEDIELVRTGYEAFVAGDIVWLNEHLHENIVWHVTGTSSLSGEQRGREAVLAYLAKLIAVALPEFDIHDVAAGEDHVIAVLDGTWRRPDGATFQGRAVQVFHVGEGQILEAWLLPEDQRGFDAFLDGSA